MCAIGIWWRKKHYPPSISYWDDEDMQIVSETIINFLKENGITPIEPTEHGTLYVAYYGQKIDIDLSSNSIYLVDTNWNVCHFQLDDPACFEKLVAAICSKHGLIKYAPP